MIKANELRIGNWLQNSLQFQVNAPDILEIDVGDMLADPIPITKEWLVRFGFEAIEIDDTIDYVKPLPKEYTEASFAISATLLQVRLPQKIKDETGSVVNEYDTYYTGLLWIDEHAPYYCVDLFITQYVHQLQNLYFALTGEELKTS